MGMEGIRQGIRNFHNYGTFGSRQRIVGSVWLGGYIAFSDLGYNERGNGDGEAMKRFVAGILVAAGLAGTACAADLAARQVPPPLYTTPAVTWSGFYFGGHGGYGWSDFDFRDPAVTITTPGFSASLGIPLERKFKASNGMIGPQAGINAQFGPIVVGVEGDFSWTSMRGTYRSTSGPTAIGPFVLSTFEGAAAKVDWLSTLRSRVGFAF